MTQSVHQKRVQFEDKPITPIFTFGLIFAMLACFAFAQMGRMEFWLSHNAFQEARVMELMHKSDYSTLLTTLFTATFASFNIVGMALNIYFFWVFGKHVESKVGPFRFIFLLTAGLFGPWILLYFLNQSNAKDLETYYISPAMMLCTIIGCYMVFPPVPKSKIGKGASMRPRQEIFRRDERADPLDKYTANPYTFVGVFAGFQIALHLWCTVGFAMFEPMKGYETIAVIPAFVFMAIGYGIGWIYSSSATQTFKEGPLQMAAIKRYHELVDLDVSHEDALKGTAKTLGLPYEKVRDWIQKNKGKLRTK